MVTVVEVAAAGTPGMGGVCGMSGVNGCCGMSSGVAVLCGMSSGVAGWGVTGGMMPPPCPGVMGGRPGVVGMQPPAGLWTGTQTAGNAGAGACPPPSNVRVTAAARPVPQRPQK